MTNREKFNSVYNDVLADMLSVIIDEGVKCKFCAYTTGDCFGKSCFEGIKKWLRINRNKFNEMDNTELADILSRTLEVYTCKFCRYTKEKCLGKSCTEGIEKWLNASEED